MRCLAMTMLLTIVLITATCASVDARPRKGFLKGPYLTLEVGAIQNDYDRDQITGTYMGDRFEPALGFLFGWNLTDNFSAELQGLYTTFKESGRKRAHIANANVSAKWTFILDALTDFKTLRILPFTKMGMSVRVAGLPSAIGATDNVIDTIGWGPAVGGGIAFLWHKYFFFGFDVQGDLLLFDDKRQTVSGIPNTLVYKGGFYPSLTALAILGVHY